MVTTVFPGEIRGQLAAMPSKSHAHRLLIAAALSEGETQIAASAASRDVRATMGEDGGGQALHDISSSRDVRATISCLEALCARVERDGDRLNVRPRPASRAAALDCGESGSTYRFLLPVACALGVEARFQLAGRLPERPMEPLLDQLEAHGAQISGRGARVLTSGGRLRGGFFELPGGVSSQFVSGLCLALPLTGDDCEIAIRGNLESRGYVDMTLDTLSAFGVRVEFDGHRLTIAGGQAYRSPGRASVEGDWSGAAIWLCAAAGGGDVKITGLDPGSTQGDRAVLDILARMGARVSHTADSARARRGAARGVDVDMRNVPDLAPALALAAATAEGETRLYGAGRLRLKESDRLTSIASALNSIGAEARVEADSLIIRGSGGRRLRGGRADAQNDHRVAMLLSCAAALCEGPVTIDGAEAVGKSYPAFFDDLAAMGLTVAREAETKG